MSCNAPFLFLFYLSPLKKADPVRKCSIFLNRKEAADGQSSEAADGQIPEAKKKSSSNVAADKDLGADSR